MLKIIKDSTLVPTPIVDLKLDAEPRQGSTDPVTSEGIANAIAGASGALDERLTSVEESIPDTAGADNQLVTQSALDAAEAGWQAGYTPKGDASVSTLNGLTGQSNGDTYILTDSGTLSAGSLSVSAGDSVAWDATNSKWYKVSQYALEQYGTNEVHNLATTITAFRTGDVIPVDGPSGTAKMGKDTLLEITKENAQDGLLPACFTNDIYNKTHPAIGVVLGVYLYDVDPNLEALHINIDDTTIYAFKTVSGTSSNNNFTIDNSGIQFISISAYKAVILYDVTRLGGGLSFGTGLLNLTACQNAYASMKAFFAANYGKIAPKQAFPSFFTDGIANVNNPAVGIIKEVYIKSADAGLETLNINIDRDKIYVFKKISGTSTNNILTIDSSGIVELNVSTLNLFVVYDKSKMLAGETYRTGLVDIDSCKNAYNSPSAFLYSSYGNQDKFLKQRDGIASLFVGDITLADVDTIGFYSSGNVTGRTITDKPPMWSGETFFYFIVFHRLCKVLVDDTGGIYWYINDTWITGGIDGVWVRLGDSITKGTYSAGGASAVDDRKSYQFIANKWRFRKQMVNLGVGGMGWRRKTSDTNKCAKDVVDDIGSTYNGAIISLAFGVNDWIFGGVLGTSSDAMTADTIFGAIRYCIYNVITNNPKSQVFVVAPMNCWSNSAPAPDYAYGTANSDGVTLLDIKNAIKTICEEYGVMFIDFGDSVINKLNITTQLNDTVHPTQTAHIELAREACNKFPCW